MKLFDTGFEESRDPCADKKLDRMYNFDLSGIKEEVSFLDEQVVQRFSDGVSLVDGKYHVEVPWKEEVADVPSNFWVMQELNVKDSGGMNDYPKIYQRSTTISSHSLIY